MQNRGEVFSAMADPTRRAILTLLGSREALAVGAIAEEFPKISRAAVSAHLRVLRAAEMVEEERQGQFRVYRLGPNRADEVIQFLKSVYADDLDEFIKSV